MHLLIALVLAGGPVAGAPVRSERSCLRPADSTSKQVWKIAFQRQDLYALATQLESMTGLKWSVVPHVPTTMTLSLSGPRGQDAALTTNALVDAMRQGFRALGFQIMETEQGCLLYPLEGARTAQAVQVTVARDGKLTIAPELSPE